jgi:hypothetical protein
MLGLHLGLSGKGRFTIGRNRTYRKHREHLESSEMSGQLEVGPREEQEKAKVLESER